MTDQRQDIIVPPWLIDLAVSPFRYALIAASFVLPERSFEALGDRMDIPAWHLTRWIGAAYLAIACARDLYRQRMAVRRNTNDSGVLYPRFSVGFGPPIDEQLGAVPKEVAIRPTR